MALAEEGETTRCELMEVDIVVIVWDIPDSLFLLWAAARAREEDIAEVEDMMTVVPQVIFGPPFSAPLLSISIQQF